KPLLGHKVLPPCRTNGRANFYPEFAAFFFSSSFGAKPATYLLRAVHCKSESFSGWIRVTLVPSTSNSNFLPPTGTDTTGDCAITSGCTRTGSCTGGDSTPTVSHRKTPFTSSAFANCALRTKIAATRSFQLSGTPES